MSDLEFTLGVVGVCWVAGCFFWLSRACCRKFGEQSRPFCWCRELPVVLDHEGFYAAAGVFVEGGSVFVTRGEAGDKWSELPLRGDGYYHWHGRRFLLRLRKRTKEGV